MNFTIHRLSIVVLLSLPWPPGLCGLNTVLPGGQAGRFCTPPETAGPDWLVAHDGTTGRWTPPSPSALASDIRVSEVRASFPLPYAAAEETSVAGTSATSEWKQVGIYALEFGGAAVGTCVAATASYAASSAAHADWTEPGRQAILGLAAYAVSSALLSSASTHLVGVLCNSRRPYTHALIGGATGGVLGAVLLRHAFWRSQLGLVPVGLVLAPLGSVAAYNF